MIKDALKAMDTTMTPEQIEQSDAIYREELAKMLSKRVTIQPGELYSMVQLGKRPLLVCNKTVDELGIDSPWELGMYARVKSVAMNDEYGGGGFDITVDLTEFSRINDGMAPKSWYIKGQSSKKGTCKEAGWWTPEETIWVQAKDFELQMVDESGVVPHGFAHEFNALSLAVHETAKSKGWWDKPRSDGEVLVLVHAEISEAVEALRSGNPPDHHCPEFTGLEVELADAIIRIMDYGAFKGLRIGEAIMAKIEYNKSRPVRHGGREF